MHAPRWSLIPLFLALFLAAFLSFGGLQASAQTPDSSQLEEGARLYAENCAVCHGENGEGRVGATLAKNWPSVRPDLSIRATIERGIQGSPMPAWSQEHGGPLTDEQIDALVAYILSWETGAPFKPPPTQTAAPRAPITPVPQVEGDPNHGAILYDQNCAVCHGEDLEGRIGATLSKDWSGIRPDQNIKQTISNGVQGSPMPAWSQANGGPLTETDINDLVSFILSQEGGNILVDTSAPAAEAEARSPFAGWGGVLVLVVGLIVVIGLALIVQTRR